MTRVLLDATTLIALGTIGELRLLSYLDGELVVPPAVRREVTTEPASTNLDRLFEQPQAREEAPPADWIADAAALLDESSETGDVQLLAFVLAHTAEERSIGVVSDDQRVRTTAGGLGATVTGTIGIIVRAVDEGVSTDTGLEILDQMDSHGLHLTGSLRVRAEGLIEDAGGERG